jgi:hypothetical protein
MRENFEYMSERIIGHTPEIGEDALLSARLQAVMRQFNDVWRGTLTTDGHAEIANGSMEVTHARVLDSTERALQATHEYDSWAGMSEHGEISTTPMAKTYVIYARACEDTSSTGLPRHFLMPTSISAIEHDLTEEKQKAEALEIRKARARAGEGLETIENPQLAVKALAEEIVKMDNELSALQRERAEELPPKDQTGVVEQLELIDELSHLLGQSAVGLPH